jgi:hypothetical protein
LIDESFWWSKKSQWEGVIQKGSREGLEQLRTHISNLECSEWLQQVDKGKKFKVPKTLKWYDGEEVSQVF